jgi:diguanylate cyclase (GGDEF)-like protein/PAS domain S-box-containing protein
VSLSWEERAARVRAGEIELASEPAKIDDTTYRVMFEALFRHTADSIVLCHSVTGEYYEVSDLFCELTGYARHELLGSSSASLHLVDPSGVRLLVQQDGVTGRRGIYENLLTRKDGTQRWVEFSHQDIGADHTLVIVRDVTKTRELEASLRELASTDPLTHVLNSRTFHERAEAALREAADAVLFIADIDNLKVINDTWGHAIGDDAIITIAQALQAAAGPSAVVGRLGGDEFAALIAGTGDELLSIVPAVKAALAEVPFGSDEHKVSASVGVARGHLAYDALKQAADAAMYEGKRMRVQA